MSIKKEVGTIRSTILILLVTLTGSAAAVYFFYCPCERVPGGWLLGEQITTPIGNWQFANEPGLCQIEVTDILPHSINLNCMSADGQLYLSCMNCEGKKWSTTALKNPDGRIRIDGRVYPVTMRRVTDDAELTRAWLARAAKTGSAAGQPRPDHWWSFELRSP
jgi:hypothetical protein